MLIERSDKVLAFSVAVLVAAMVGVTLGHSAIGAINPLYFQGPAPPPQAVDGRERQPSQPAYYQAYSWEQGAEARAIACPGDCGLPGAYYDPSFYAYPEAPPPPRMASSAWQDEGAVIELAPWPPGQVSTDRERAVTRYADYPIEAKPEATAGKEDVAAEEQQADPPEE